MPGFIPPKPMKNPVRLNRIAGLSEAQKTSLSAYWITSIQEFLAIAELPEGRIHLTNILHVDHARLDELLERAANEIPPERGPGKSLEFEAMIAEYSTGAVKTPAKLRAGERYETIPFTGDLPNVIDFTQQLPSARDQGVRGTCVAYAAAVVRELLEIHYLNTAGVEADIEEVNLSEQFIYWWCKEQDNLPDVNGTYPHLGMECLQAVGSPKEQVWPYNNKQLVGNEGQGPPPGNALGEAWKYRIKRVIRLDPKNIGALKIALTDGKALLFSIPIFNSWYQSRTVRRHGKITMPFPGEKANGAHAMALVGYVDDKEAPGGGYFLIRNSWAPWGFDNPQGAGLGTIPYAFIEAHNMMAATADRASLADVFIRKNAEDTGQTPSSEYRFNSPDIWVRRRDDDEETHQMPIVGQPNTIYVRAWNAGPDAARGVKATIYEAAASTSNWPMDWQEIGDVDFPEILDGESGIASVTWTPTDAGPLCFLARLSSPEDPVLHEWSVRSDNNLAQKNMVVLNLVPGQAAEFMFRMNGLPDKVSLMDLNVNRKQFPRGRVALRMAERQRLRTRPHLIDDEAKLSNLMTKATDHEMVGAKITADSHSKPGETGEIIFTQHYGRLLVGRLVVQVNIV